MVAVAVAVVPGINTPLGQLNANLRENSVLIGDGIRQLEYERYFIEIDRNGTKIKVQVEGFSETYMDHRPITLIDEEGHEHGPIELFNGVGRLNVAPGRYIVRFDL